MQNYNIFSQLANNFKIVCYVVEPNKDFFEVNQKTQRYFDTVITSEQLDLSKEMYRYKPFTERWKTMFNTTAMGMYLFPLFSIIVGFPFVYPLFLPTFQNLILAGICTVLFLGVIEAAKNISISQLMPMYRLNKNKIKGIMVLLIVIMFVASVSSIFIGYHGAISFVKQQDTIIKTVKTDYLKLTDSINKYYQSKIDNEQSKYDNILANPAWQGKHTSNQFRIMELCQTNIIAYRNEKNTKLSELKQNEKSDTGTAQKTVNQSGLTYALIVVMIEIFILFSIFFNRFYKYKLIKDLSDFENLKSEPDKYKSVDFVELTKPQELPKPIPLISKDKIGYNEITTEMPKDKELETVSSEPNANRIVIKGFVTESITQERPHYNTPITKICKRCGKNFEIKAFNQKFCEPNCRINHHKEKHDGKEFNPLMYHNSTNKK